MAERDVAHPPTPRFEARLPCPVCLGVPMEKVSLRRTDEGLVLDHCARCGGVWFEKGEVPRLAQQDPAELWKHIPPRASAPRPPCHGCFAPLDRDADACAACGTKNELSCPTCDRRMERRTHENLTLDVCAHCRGVWFDHAELKSVWTLALAHVSEQRAGRGSDAALVAGDVLLQSLFWAPDLVFHAGEAAVHGASHVAGALANASAGGAADAAMGAAEVVGGAAESVFETIMNIIASIFD